MEENLVYLMTGAEVFPRDLLTPRGFRHEKSAVASRAAFSCRTSSASTTAAASLGFVNTYVSFMFLVLGIHLRHPQYTIVT